MSNEEQEHLNSRDEDADKLAEPEFPPALIPREEGEPELTTEESRAKAKDPQHGGE